jgi:hypothetical protein
MKAYRLHGERVAAALCRGVTAARPAACTRKIVETAEAAEAAEVGEVGEALEVARRGVLLSASSSFTALPLIEPPKTRKVSSCTNELAPSRPTMGGSSLSACFGCSRRQFIELTSSSYSSSA